MSPKESHLECLVVRNGFCSGFFLCKFDEVNKRLVSSLGSVKFCSSVSAFDRLILAEEILTSATTKPNPKLTPTSPSTSTTAPWSSAKVLVSGAGEWVFLGERLDAGNILTKG